MRKYSAEFVKRNFVANRRTTAACPFPGKYPLRMLVWLQGTPVYHGKFEPSAFRALCRRFTRSQPDWCVIYDKAGAILWGGRIDALAVVRPDLAERYFGIYPDGQFLRNVRATKVGQYAAYLNPDFPFDRAQFLRRASTVPHVRTI